MKIYQLFLLFLGLSLSDAVWAETNNVCPLPKPFKHLNTTDAEVYALANVLAYSSLPSTTVTTEKSTQLLDNTASTKSKVQLVNFWAAWCAPCRQELPFLDNVGTTGVADVILINIGDEAKTAEKILAELEVTHLKTRLANDDILSKLSIGGLPASLVFSKQQVYLGLGRLKDEQAISRWLKCL